MLKFLHGDKGYQQEFTETILHYRQQPILLAREGSLAWFFRGCGRHFRRCRGRLGRCNAARCSMRWGRASPRSRNVRRRWGLGQLSAAIATHGCIRWVHRLAIRTLIFFFSNSWWSKTHVFFSLIRLMVGHLGSHAGICQLTWQSDPQSEELRLLFQIEFPLPG